MAEKIFGDGIFFTRRRESAPAFIRGQISVKVEPFVAFLKKHVNESGYVNLTLKESRSNKLYFELDTWTKTIRTAKVEADKAGDATKEAVVDDVDPNEIPF